MEPSALSLRFFVDEVKGNGSSFPFVNVESLPVIGLNFFFCDRFWLNKDIAARLTSILLYFVIHHLLTYTQNNSKVGDLASNGERLAH